MVQGVMLLWFLLTALSVVFVAVDIVKTPESTVLKWGFVLITAYIGPVGAFLYVLGCREPLPGLHKQYTSHRWRQVLGSTMHCVAGDGLGILVGAAIGGLINLSRPIEIGLEYLLGFGFGWTIFQALFMKDSAGGSFLKALKKTFIPELVSMNYLMAAMVVVMSAGMKMIPGSNNPLTMGFWFVMSMSLLIGFGAAYPVNWWLVSNHLKHGMMTIRPAATDRAGVEQSSNDSEQGLNMDAHSSTEMQMSRVSTTSLLLTVTMSFIVFGVGVAVALM